MSFDWPRYVPVAERKRNAAKELAKMGVKADPVEIQGRTIATTAWGKAWCKNLEDYSDFSNRLERGRSYVRSGAVVDLKIAPGRIEARVRGSSLYRTAVSVTPMPADAWSALCADCAGAIDSLVELLRGRFSASVMVRLCRPADGIFPSPRQIKFECSCPDGAYMCKHVAAVLYGVGSRLDREPELLFTLRTVDPTNLLAQAGSLLAAEPEPADRLLDSGSLGALFGVDFDDGVPPVLPPAAPGAASGKTAPRKVSGGKAKKRGAKTSPRDLIESELRKLGSIDNATARILTGLDAIAVRAILQEMVAEGAIRRIGNGRGTRYIV
jgi:uncharacterized Zn finger protein